MRAVVDLWTWVHGRRDERLARRRLDQLEAEMDGEEFDQLLEDFAVVSDAVAAAVVVTAGAGDGKGKD